MALRTASTASTASDTNAVPADVDGLAISAVDAAIGVATNAGEYVLRMDFEANVTNGVTTIKQSDDSYIDVEPIVLALREKGFRAAYNKKTDPGAYLLCLAVAWD
ncbi:MAG: hypothetical protein V3U02_11445 [Calditrichia bacterium]